VLPGRWVLSDADYKSLEPVRRRRGKPTAEQLRVLARARRRAAVIVAFGLALLAAGIGLVLAHDVGAGVAPLVAGLVLGAAGERAIARVQVATERARPGVPTSGAEPNGDAMSGGGHYGSFN
jgi:hypothetical protein